MKYMHIAVLANEPLKKEFENKGIPGDVTVEFISAVHELSTNVEVLFYLLPEEELTRHLIKIAPLKLLVFVNALVTPLSRLPANCVRINAWPGFFQRSITELCTSEYNAAATTQAFNDLRWKFAMVPDVPGMVSARIVAMIINEAYFALEDKAASREDIDMAMKCGTNYPYGPFEWAKNIGWYNVIHLLENLSETDRLYSPSPALLKENF